jgi:hypothetical protein
MLRDPRDVVVSQHGREPGKYWSNLRAWRQAYRAHEGLRDHPRFVVVRYEDLARNPDAVQLTLAARMPFLKATTPFSQYHDQVSDQSQQSKKFNLAMRGIRPVTDETIGAWRRHLPRLKSQIALHGGIEDELRQLGYESGDAWLRLLDGVEPDTTSSKVADHVSLTSRMERGVQRFFGATRYLARRYLG